jgi:hypothetical protein
VVLSRPAGKDHRGPPGAGCVAQDLPARSSGSARGGKIHGSMVGSMSELGVTPEARQSAMASLTRRRAWGSLPDPMIAALRASPAATPDAAMPVGLATRPRFRTALLSLQNRLWAARSGCLENGARSALRLGVCRVGRGSRSDRAGRGRSPLRGGADREGFRSLSTVCERLLQVLTIGTYRRDEISLYLSLF